MAEEGWEMQHWGTQNLVSKKTGQIKAERVAQSQQTERAGDWWAMHWWTGNWYMTFHLEQSLHSRLIGQTKDVWVARNWHGNTFRNYTAKGLTDGICQLLDVSTQTRVTISKCLAKTNFINIRILDYVFLYYTSTPAYTKDGGRQWLVCVNNTGLLCWEPFPLYTVYKDHVRTYKDGIVHAVYMICTWHQVTAVVVCRDNLNYRPIHTEHGVMWSASGKSNMHTISVHWWWKGRVASRGGAGWY